jgi:exonuclease V
MSDVKDRLEAIKKDRLKVISVTEIVNQFWCEKQLELKLLYGVDESGDHVRAGRERHEELYGMVADLVDIPPPTRKEDEVGVLLHNAIVGARRLLLRGLTRELFVFGNLDGWFLYGYVDEVKVVGGELRVIERKTRARSKRPTSAQIYTHRIQGMLYHALLNNLQRGGRDFGGELLHAFGLHEDARMSDEYLDELVRMGLLKEGAIELEKDLRKKANYYSRLLGGLPPLSDEITITYESQRDGREIYRETFQFDADFLHEKLKFAREYWEGKRRAYSVSRRNRWKCNYCPVKVHCEPTR